MISTLIATCTPNKAEGKTHNAANMDGFLCFLLMWRLCIKIKIIESLECGFVVVTGV